MAKLFTVDPSAQAVLHSIKVLKGGALRRKGRRQRSAAEGKAFPCLILKKVDTTQKSRSSANEDKTGNKESRGIRPVRISPMD